MKIQNHKDNYSWPVKAANREESNCTSLCPIE